MSDEGSQAPDFRREVSISDRAGSEFFGASVFNPAQTLVAFGPQIVIAVIAVLYAVASLFTPLPEWGVFVLMPLGAVAGAALMARLRPAREPDLGLGSAFSSGTDPRYRLRLVAPRSLDRKGVAPWLRPSVTDDADPDERELAYHAGGFEPIVLRAWFCVRRGRAYALTLAIALLLCVAGVVLATRLLGASLMFWLDAGMSFALFGVLIVVLFGAWLLTEAVWPVYLRLASGRLDIFRYPLIGRGRPKVSTFDLRRVGLCAHLGVWSVAIEPARPFEGEGPPEMGRSSTWPYNKIRLPEHRPETLSLGLLPRRREFVCRLFQAARTDEPTPPLPEFELTG